MMNNLRLRTGLIYGGITSVISMLIGLALASFGLSDMSSGGNGMVNALILVLGIYLAAEAFKKNNEGFLSSGDLIVVSLWLGLIVGIVSGLFSWIYLNYIDPEMMKKIIKMAEIKMEEQGNSDEQIEMAMQMMDKVMSPPILITISVLMNLFFSLVLGAIMALFLKREKPVF